MRINSTLRFLFVLCASHVGPMLWAQLHVSFQQQGAETLRTLSGKRLPGVGVGRVAVCNVGPAARDVDAEFIYLLAGRVGISTLSPIVAGPVLDRSIATSFAQFLVDLSTLGSGLVGVLGLSNKIKMPTWAAELLTAAPAVFLLFRGLFQKRLASDQPAKDNLLRGVYPGIAPARCIPDGRIFLFRYSGDWAPREVTLP